MEIVSCRWDHKVTPISKLFNLHVILLIIFLGYVQPTAADKVVVVPMFDEVAAAKWLGPWESDKAYREGDLVQFDESSYISLIDHTSSINNIPPDEATWDLVAAAGEDGNDGIDGIDGIDGAPGPQGLPGEDGSDGISATATVNSTATLSPGSPATVVDIDPSPHGINLDFSIPQGEKGEKGDAISLNNVITVSAYGGDFTDPIAAMDSIVDNGPNNRYQLILGPGEYQLTQALNMKPYVEIIGSGRSATWLTGTGIHSLVSGADHAGISHLSLKITEGTTHSMGVSNVGTSPRLNDLGIMVSDGGNNYGVRNVSGASPIMTDISIAASGGTYNRGVYNNTGSSPTMANMSITVSGGTYNWGVQNFSSSPTMKDLVIMAAGATEASNGVANNSSSPNMFDLKISASGESYSYGIKNSASSSPQMVGLVIAATGGTDSNYGIENLSSSPTMTDLMITVSDGYSSRGIQSETSSIAVRNTSITVSGNNHSYGIYSYSASTSTLFNISIDATGGLDNNYGIINDSSTSKISNLAITASGGTYNNYGIENKSSSVAHIHNSTISGADKSVVVDSSSGADTYIFHSVLTGPVSGTPGCAYTVDSTGIFLTDDCSPP